MKEVGRILSNRRFLSGLVLIILLNALLFVREQSAKDYGLDCSMPTPSILVFDGSIPASESIDAKAAYEHYLDWMDKTKRGYRVKSTDHKILRLAMAAMFCP